MEAIKSKIKFKAKGVANSELLELYKNLMLPRMIEEKMLILLRQGKISKWFSGIGQEAISVGVTYALDQDEFIFPMHRNLGVFTTRGMSLFNLFCQWQGKEQGYTNGRDRSFHFGSKEHHIVGMISHLGPQLSLANGIALGHKLDKAKKIAVAFTGEGGTSEGEFHEAMNIAAVWNLPVIFVIENNGYGLSTPSSEQYATKKLSHRGKGYGMRSLTIDGNNVLKVYKTIKKLSAEIKKNPHPVLLECNTFRIRGHEEASGVKYVPSELIEEWSSKDPISNFEQFLLAEGHIDIEEINIISSNIKEGINNDLKEAEKILAVEADTAIEKAAVYSLYDYQALPSSTKTKEIRFIDAITEGLDEAMASYSDLILMGQDIAEYGGVFKVTEGFLKKYGKERVRNTPLCESGVIGAALGLSILGKKSMVEMQFADFVTCGFNQIVNNLAKINYRWGQNANIVIRMPTGGTVGAGPFHSQCTESWFFHVPGLKIVYPSNPTDAKGLLIEAFRDPNPVLYFEHKGLYRSIKDHVPEGKFTTPIGKASTVVEGMDLSIITYGMGVIWAQEVRNELNLDIEILDLRTLMPLDYHAIEATVKKTGKVLILHEDTLTGGIGAEIAAYISEHHFKSLDGPVRRTASLDTPYPFAKNLEDNFLPIARLKKDVLALLAY